MCRGPRSGTREEELPEFTFARAIFGVDSDHETVVSSGTESEDDEGEPKRKDYIRGLAQRATEPDFKQRIAKGPFIVSFHVSSVCARMPIMQRTSKHL